jgi:CheY-like chemotaxis protein
MDDSGLGSISFFGGPTGGLCRTLPPSLIPLTPALSPREQQGSSQANGDSVRFADWRPMILPLPPGGLGWSSSRIWQGCCALLLRRSDFEFRLVFMAKKILIVDDDRETVELLRLALHSEGYAIRTAVTGREALRKALLAPPDLVVLDLILPGLHGFNVCERLRSHSATAAVPIIMVTAWPGELPRLAGMEAGADVYLRKPFEIQELISRVGDLLRRTQVCPAGPRESQRVVA